VTTYKRIEGDRLRVDCQKIIAYGKFDVGFWITIWNQLKNTMSVCSLEKRPMLEGMPNEPTFMTDESTAQLLMDSLWNAGFRPTEGKSSIGAMKACEYHLEDMRKIVFDIFLKGKGNGR